MKPTYTGAELDHRTMPTAVDARLPRRPGASRDRWLLPLALLTIYLVWGSTYLGIAVAIETIPPFLMSAVRFILAGLLLLGWARISERGAFAMPTRRQWRDAFIVGGLLFGVGNGFVGWGEQTVASGIAALLIALVAVWLAVFSRLLHGDRLPRVVGIGIAVGIAGVGLLVWPLGDGPLRLEPFGVAALIVAPMGWANGSIFSARRADLPASPLVATASQMFAGGVVLALESGVTGELGRLHAAVSIESIVALVYLLIFGSLVAFSAYAWLLRHAPLPLIGTYAFVNPVVAVGLGAIVLAEPITPRMLGAAAVIVVGVAVVILGRSRLSISPARDVRAEPPSPLREPASDVA